ncbi:MAG: hypothetical protein RLZZ387_4905 [Chloroflexota bacterium]|jgi:hypothetical protein
MKIEIDGNGLRVVVVWTSVRSLLKALVPVITGILAFLSAPQLTRLIELLGVK